MFDENLLIIKESNLDPNKMNTLRDLYIIIKRDDGKIIDLRKEIKIKLNNNYQEKIWGLAKNLIEENENILKWSELANIVGQSKNSLLRFDERSRAKPLLVYKKLMGFLKSNKVEINWEDLEKNIERVIKGKNAINLRFPFRWMELGLGKIQKIKLNIPLLSWDELNKKPKSEFSLKDFLIKVKFENPYFHSERKRHENLKKIGKKYIIDFTKKLFVHIKKQARDEIFDAFLKIIPGANKRIKLENATKLLGYYKPKTLIYFSDHVGIPLKIPIKIIYFLRKNGIKKYDFEWLQENLEGISSGERKFYKIKFPINWKTHSGIKVLSAFIGDGGLGFRSNLLAWAVPHYSQFKHKELLLEFVRAVKMVYSIDINPIERIDLPAVCGYIIVASGYFCPGHKSYTNPSLPVNESDDISLIATCLNCLISDDGCFNKYFFTISSGSYYAKDKPLKYMKDIERIIHTRIPEIRTAWKIEKRRTKNMLNTTFILILGGGIMAMRKLYKLFKKYNAQIFANAKWESLERYSDNAKFSISEYKKRYKRYISINGEMSGI